MFKPVGRASGPAQYLRCEACGTTFEMDLMLETNVVKIMAYVASDNRGGMTLAERYVPKCPKCGAHPPSED